MTFLWSGEWTKLHFNVASLLLFGSEYRGEHLHTDQQHINRHYAGVTVHFLIHNSSRMKISGAVLVMIGFVLGSIMGLLRRHKQAE